MPTLQEQQQNMQRQQQLLLQRSQARLNQQQALMSEDDREMRQVMTVMDPKIDWITPEQKAAAFNNSRLPKIFGFDAPITAEALNPLHGLVTRAHARINGKQPGRMDDLMPLFEMFQSNPAYFDRADQAKMVELQGQVRDVQARAVVQEPEAIAGAKARLEQFAPFLEASTKANWADLYANHTTGAIASKLGIQGEHVRQLDQVLPDANAFVNLLRRDVATVEADQASAQERERVRFLLQSNPAALAKAAEGKIKEAGFSDNPADNHKIRALNILQRPLENWTPEERSFVNAWGTTFATKEQAEQLGLMTSRQWADQAKQDMENSLGRRTLLTNLTDTASKAAGEVSGLATLREQTIKAISTAGNKTLDEQAVHATNTQRYMDEMKTREEAFEQVAAPQVQYLTDSLKQMSEQTDAIRRRLATAPSSQREGLGARLKDMERTVEGHRAGLRLLTDESPFAIETLKSSRDGITVMLQTAKQRGESELASKYEKELASTTGLLDQLETARKQDIARIEANKLHLLEREKAARLRLTSAEAKVEKDEAVRLATQYSHQLHREGMPWTRAMTQASSEYRVKPAEVVEQNKYWIQHEADDRLSTAQRELGIMAQAQQMQSGTALDDVALTKLTTTLMGDPRFAGLKREDIQKGIKEAPLVTVKLGEETDKVIAKNLEESQAAAEGAIGTVDAANRIEQALSAGKVTLGPTATIRNQINQFSQILGVGGRDTAEQLVNTRGVIRGLAQFALGARKQLKGQGQVSDYEGRLIERAEAGQIDDFTMPELKAFVAVTKQLAVRQHTQHQKQVERFRNTPTGRERAAFFEVEPLPTQPAPSAQPQGFSIRPDHGFKVEKVK